MAEASPSIKKDPTETPCGEYLFAHLKGNAIECSNPAQIDVESSKAMSFSELLEASVRAAVGWRHLGLKTGDILAMICNNKQDIFPAVNGALFEGITLLLIIPSSKEAEVRNFCSLVKPRAVLSEPCNYDLVRRAAGPDVLHVVAGDVADPEAVTLDSVLAPRGVGPHQYQPPHIPDVHTHTAIILFSSGTTGLPKAVAYSNNSLLMMTSDYTLSTRGSPQELVLITSTLSWISGIITCIRCMNDGLTRLVANYTTEEAIIDMLVKFKVTTWFVSPPRLVLVAADVQRMAPRPDLSSLRVVVAGGSALSAHNQRLATQVLEAFVFQVYGCTECPLISGDVPPQRDGSVGKHAKQTKLRIVDLSSGEDIETPEGVGEIRVKNLCTMREYVGNPEATREAFDEQGFIRTGDLGYRDADGYLYIKDRIRGKIKYDGFEVSLAELEAVLSAHPGVREACVVGRPHPRLGAIPTAFVVRSPESGVTDRELQDLVTEQLLDYKRLRGGIYFIEEIPKSINGKMDAKTLTDKLCNEKEYRIDVVA